MDYRDLQLREHLAEDKICPFCESESCTCSDDDNEEREASNE